MTLCNFSRLTVSLRLLGDDTHAHTFSISLEDVVSSKVFEGAPPPSAGGLSPHFNSRTLRLPPLDRKEGNEATERFATCRIRILPFS